MHLFVPNHNFPPFWNDEVAFLQGVKGLHFYLTECSY